MIGSPLAASPAAWQRPLITGGSGR